MTSTSFQSNFSLDLNLKHSYEWSVSFAFIYSVIFLFGIVGNSLIIFVIYTKPNLQNVTNIFILNLAVADLLVIGFCLPATLTTTLFKPWILGPVMCKVMPYIQGISVFASAYSLVAISVDRCLGIRSSLESLHRLSKSQAKGIIALIWLAAGLLFIPWLIEFEVKTHGPDDLQYCVEIWSSEALGVYYYFIANLLVCYILPLVLVLTMSLCIWSSVSQRKNSIQWSASFREIRKHHKKTEKSVSKTLSLIISAFMLSWLPFYIVISRVKLSIVTPISEEELNILSFVIPFVQLLGLSNSCMNPVIYSYTNPKFCSAVKSVIWKDDSNAHRFQYSALSKRSSVSNSITPKSSIPNENT